MIGVSCGFGASTSSDIFEIDPLTIEPGAEMLILHGIIPATTFRTKLAGETFDVVDMPANARVVRVLIAGVKSSFLSAEGAPAVNAWLKTSNERWAFSVEADGPDWKSLAIPSPAAGVSEVNQFPTFWYKESVPYTLQLEVYAGTDVANIEEDEDLQYWVEYVQE